ncbi:catalase family protein [Variovorax saccharolyticus]|uniref:catalase family protein n=1 Tax=Variovorax saccharolyticus TaxID=3053516 RepID=UPI002575CB81|nr:MULTISPECIES: catalase family protein [unclassified Variovorax]MDM0022870.1 catalase family protein [Variovorax sp. J22R187]MDM0029680.1 catalase family protein [Variovorax sp. J31P216]
MNTVTTPTPVRYHPDVETPSDDEPEVFAELRETLLEMSRTMLAHTGHGLRSVHAKSFALLHGTLEVLPGLPATLAQGLFAAPACYDLIARLSTPPAEELDDRVSLPRGIALKIIGVEGARLAGTEDDRTQDFLMVDGPVFNAPDTKHFLRSLKQLAATTDKAEGGKRALSVILRGAATALGAVGIESPTLVALGGHKQTHPLGATFFTQAPQRYGDYIAKLCLVPVSPSLTSLRDKPLSDDLADDPEGLRQSSNDFFASGAGEWELRVQLNTDLERMPIEDASVPWPEDLSPYVAVARVRIGSQTGWSEERSKAVDDGLSFNPWHGLDAHRPLGDVMRARKAVYPASAAFRSAANGCPLHEPESAQQAFGSQSASASHASADAVAPVKPSRAVR